MAVPVPKTSFVTGEVSPKLFGHVDLARFQSAASTMRNGFVAYTGGYNSRAGTAFVGFSKQTGRLFPPRLISFQFNIGQGLVLEFGNFYMRVVLNGAFVTEAADNITSITQANPAVMTASALGALAATPILGGVTSSYAPGDTVTMAGGTFTTPGVLTVGNTYLSGATAAALGAGYAPTDTIVPAGGTQAVAPSLTVTTTQVVSATVDVAGSGGTNGTATVAGTTGTGTRFQANVTIAGGVMTAVNSITLRGSYTTNPTTISAEPVTGGGLSGAKLAVVMGVNALTVTSGGSFSANPTGNTLTQGSTSGGGTGATFTGIFAPLSYTVTSPGVYTVFPANPVGQASSSGFGQGATFNLTTQIVSSFATGDWVFVSGALGMTQVNGQTYVLVKLSATTFQLFDVYGNPIDSTAFSAYTGGGTAARIYTLPTIYAEQDLPYLKVTESADDMSLCCVNQQSVTEYPPQDLTRLADDNWVFSPVIPAPSVTPPVTTSAAASTSGSVDYQYVVTSVASDGTESIASPVAEVDSAVDITATAGTITITWSAVLGVNEYNIYKATPGYSTAPPVGALFGYAGSAYGAQFIDSNIVADFTQVPPQHQNPFARGQVIGAPVQAGGSGYSTITLTINSLTGSGAVLTGVLQSTGGGPNENTLVAVIVEDAGEGYLASDTITITGDGSGAAANLTVGAQSGTYPSVPGYFQQRRVYANTLNNPDTYFMSQPGAFTNFDTRIPTIASDAITGSPWSQEVNGIQAMLQTIAGLLVMTGLQNWLLVGQGSAFTNVQAITPSSQVANRQTAIGCSPTVPPVEIGFDVIFVNAKGSFYFDQPYQLYALSEPIDLTENSSHLFTGYKIREHAWCEQPYKLLWSVRNDGIMLSLTYYKTQQVAGWGRHDTQGLFQSVCAVTEPPVDALYAAVQRFPAGKNAYMIERMDNRIWTAGVESCWCVDAGLALPQPTPAAILTASSATGLGACTGVTGLAGGANYSAGATAVIVDMGVKNNGEGPGLGAAPTLTIVAGIITAVAFLPGSTGTGYVNPVIQFYDPAGSGGGSGGASAQIILDNSATFSASAAVFSAGNVGSVIRMGGGVATITAFTDTRHVVANLSTPITQMLLNSGGTPLPQMAGAWTLTKPVSTISGLNHLIGMSVVGLADGNIITPRTVDATGSITLDVPASAVVVGLKFRAQLQGVYLDTGAPTVQGQRKKVADVTVRIEASRDITAGSNQTDGSTLSPPQLAPAWTDMAALPNKAIKAYNSATVPLFTGDVRVPVFGGFQTPGQVCVQQDNPLPMNILAFIVEELPGDEPELRAPQQQGRGR